VARSSRGALGVRAKHHSFNASGVYYWAGRVIGRPMSTTPSSRRRGQMPSSVSDSVIAREKHHPAQLLLRDPSGGVYNTSGPIVLTSISGGHTTHNGAPYRHCAARLTPLAPTPKRRISGGYSHTIGNIRIRRDRAAFVSQHRDKIRTTPPSRGAREHIGDNSAPRDCGATKSVQAGSRYCSRRRRL